MLIKFDETVEICIPNFKGGTGTVSVALFSEGRSKIMKVTIPADASIGRHSHHISAGVCYVISGCGKAVCDDEEELLSPGVVHFCPEGSTHTIQNTGAEDLVLCSVELDL